MSHTRSDDQGAVETDERNYARVKAGSTCRRVLIPRANPQTQLDWRVTLAEGARYAPPDQTGIYAKEVDCKHGVQSNADVFGRDTVSIAAGGKTQDVGAGEQAVLGTRILGSVLSEGSVHTTTPATRGEQFQQRPIIVFGDVIGGHVTVEQPLLVYGNVVAEQTLRVDAPTIVMGETHSHGTLDARTLCTLSVAAREDISLREDVLVTNPVVRSMAGDIEFEEPVGLLDSLTVNRIQQRYDTGSVPLGQWLFEESAAWEPGVLREADLRKHDGGTVASRAWRTVEESVSEYEFLRSGIASQAGEIRSDPPSIEEMPPTTTDPTDGSRAWAGVSLSTDRAQYDRATQRAGAEIPTVETSPDQ